MKIVPPSIGRRCQCRALLFGLFIPLLAATAAPSPPRAQSAPSSSRKKLIEFGWDEPDTAFLHAHLPDMEQTPFDGCVFHILYRTPQTQTGNFTWECWGRRAFSEAELEQAVDDLLALRPSRFKFNFLRFNTTPGELDWFDDYSAVTNNARVAASVARQGQCAGLLFDIEQYQGQLFDYRKQRDAASKSWELYAAQARQRGREVMHSFQAGFPGLTVFLTFGYSLPWSEANNGRRSLAECHYGLLAPFLDGMVQAAEPGVRLVDGYELSYGFKETNRFDRAYFEVRTGLLPIVADPEKYRRLLSVGFGIWMDHDWRKLGWTTTNLSANSFSPDAFERSVRQALATADEFVWIYTEKPRWWSSKGGPVDLPRAYEQALRGARP